MKKKPNTQRCNCNKGYKISCTNCSRIKMVMLLNTNYKHLKETLTGTNRKVNPVRYNPMKENDKADDKIINGMLRRFRTSKYGNATNVVQFFDNRTKELLKTYKIV